MNDIYVKAFYGDWYKVTPEEAKEFVRKLMNGMTNLEHNEKIECINKLHLKGITYEQLFRC